MIKGPLISNNVKTFQCVLENAMRRAELQKSDWKLRRKMPWLRCFDMWQRQLHRSMLRRRLESMRRLHRYAPEGNINLNSLTHSLT